MSRGVILIVEDEFVVAENLRTELESMDYEVAGLASSGREAMELARRDRPDLALMDIRLRGDMDGVETATHLRQEMDVPVLFLTAFADEGLLERAKAVEPLGYMVKPYQRKALRASIEMAHYKARMERLLKESESRFRGMFENSPTAYLAMDEHEHLVDCNTVLCELLGYDREELIGRGFGEFRSLSREEASFKIEDEERAPIELELARKDRTPLTVLLEGHVQRDPHGVFLRRHCILHNITERRRIEEELRRSEEALRYANELLERRVEERTLELRAKTANLEEVNIALRVLLDRREEDRKEFEEALAGNLKSLVLPYVEKLRKTRLSPDQATFLSILQSHLAEIGSRLVRKLSLEHKGFTPTEMQVAVLIRDGQETKDIAEVLRVSIKAVEFHRNNIRRKLGITNKKENLRSHLIALSS